MSISLTIAPDLQEIIAIEMPEAKKEHVNLDHLLSKFNTKALFYSYTMTDKYPSVDYWHSADKYKKPSLQGNIMNCKKLVLRFRRNADGAVSVTAVGIIRKICVFRSLADFSVRNQEFTSRNSFLSQIPHAVETLNFSSIEHCVERFMSTEEDDSLSDFLPVLVRYSSHDSSLNFEQRKNYGIYEGKRYPNNRSTDRAPWVLTYSNNAPIPAEHKITARMEGVSEEFKSALIALLEVKPIWTKQSLSYELRPNFGHLELQKLLKNSLPYFCYNFSKGPWRHCWIKYGYDPRLHPESRFLQTVYLRNVYWNRSEANSHVIHSLPNFSTEREHIFDGKTISSNLALFQLCDLVDDDCKLLIESGGIRDTQLSDQDGWFPDGFTLKLRQIISSKIEKLLKNVNWIHKSRSPVVTSDSVPKKISKSESSNVSATEMFSDESNSSSNEDSPYEFLLD